MKVEKIVGPTIPSAPNTSNRVAAREAAINILMGNKSQAPAAAAVPQQDIPVRNASQVTPEEIHAISPTATMKPQLSQSQNTIVEGQDSAPQEAAKPREESPLSERHALLARREKQIRQREQQIRAKELAIKAAEDAARSATPAKPALDESKYVPKDRLTQDPFTVLNELGLTYDQLTELALNAPKPEQLAMMNEIKTLKAELQAVKGETEKTQKSIEEQNTKSYQQALNDIKHQVTRLVSSDPAFETIKATRSVGDVVELIEKTYNEDGILMTVEEAAQQVEDYLVDEAVKIARLNKIQQKMKPATTLTSQTKPNGQSPQQPQMKTLTNSVSSSRPLSAKERALLAFEGRLNK